MELLFICIGVFGFGLLLFACLRDVKKVDSYPFFDTRSVTKKIVEKTDEEIKREDRNKTVTFEDVGIETEYRTIDQEEAEVLSVTGEYSSIRDFNGLMEFIAEDPEINMYRWAMSNGRQYVAGHYIGHSTVYPNIKHNYFYIELKYKRTTEKYKNVCSFIKNVEYIKMDMASKGYDLVESVLTDDEKGAIQTMNFIHSFSNKETVRFLSNHKIKSIDIKEHLNKCKYKEVLQWKILKN